MNSNIKLLIRDYINAVEEYDNVVELLNWGESSSIELDDAWYERERLKKLLLQVLEQ